MRKYVITGGSSSGKTEVINEARKRGIIVLEEVARKVLSGKSNIDYRKNVFKIQKEIFDRQLMAENNLNAEGEIVLLDRGLIDVLAYTKYFLGDIPLDFLSCNLRRRYSGVFILERGLLENDGVRIERNNEEANKIHEAICESYAGFGYSPVCIPFYSGSGASPRKLNIILNKIKDGRGK